MALHPNQQNIDARRSAFNHVIGNQYNIHVAPPHPSSPSHRFPLDDDVSVPVDLKYCGDERPVISKVVILDAKTKLTDLNEEGCVFNEVVRTQLGDQQYNSLAFVLVAHNFFCDAFYIVL
jgi:hypothetical protein